ncbi:MAG TPA: DoxX family protein [Kofleriaceae bacterium]|jgi:uncharacterized protein YbjT (DUF2867 family)
MKVILFGATGMVGKSVLRQCLRDPEVEAVLAVGRKPSGEKDPKLRDLVREDMYVAGGELEGYDACFFCLGVSSVGMNEADYTRVTYDLTLVWAKELARVSPAIRFFYVSGLGTGGKSMWARVKGRTETDLLALLPGARMVRLAALRPMHGERSKAPGGAVLLALLAPLWPVLQWLWPDAVITSEELGRALLLAARDTGGKRILESGDLVALGRHPARASTALRTSLWIAQGLLGVTLAGGGIWKLATPIPDLAAKMPWMGQVSPCFLYTTAALDILGGLGVLLPGLTRIKPRLVVGAALGCFALMIGAIVFHLSRGEIAKTPFNVLLAGLALFVAWGRGSRT